MPQLDEKYKVFLDNLRESGETNMFGAVPFIVVEFGLPEKEASKILVQWMSEFKNK